MTVREWQEMSLCAVGVGKHKRKQLGEKILFIGSVFVLSGDKWEVW